MVTRLPTQHPQHPYCPACEADLPTLDGITVLLTTELYGIEILEMLFRVRCKCGAEWILKKTCNSAG